MPSAAGSAPVKPHFFYADILRAVAIFAVIIMHNAADLATQYGRISASDWLSASFYNGICRFCVPMFVLLSGSLLLNPAKEVTIKALFTKRLPKLVIPLVFWSAFYMVFYHFFNKSYPNASFTYYLTAFYSVPLVFHFWFLYMMTGIYLVYPIINVFIGAATRQQVKYFIIVWYITSCFFGIIDLAFEKPMGIELYSFTGYIGYFVLGYYLKTFTLSKSILNLFYGLTILAFIISIAGIILLQVIHFKHANDLIESDFTPELPFAVAGLFLYLKNRGLSLAAKPTWWQNILTGLSNESYGIYILHVLVMQLLFDKSFLYFQFDSLSLLFVIPLKAFVILCLTYMVVKVLKLVPLLKFTL
jgi:surface polysaccharide O-acyltransferase-like enzyme